MVKFLRFIEDEREEYWLLFVNMTFIAEKLCGIVPVWKAFEYISPMKRECWWCIVEQDWTDLHFSFPSRWIQCNYSVNEGLRFNEHFTLLTFRAKETFFSVISVMFPYNSTRFWPPDSCLSRVLSNNPRHLASISFLFRLLNIP